MVNLEALDFIENKENLLIEIPLDGSPLPSRLKDALFKRINDLNTPYKKFVVVTLKLLSLGLRYLLFVYHTYRLVIWYIFTLYHTLSMLKRQNIKQQSIKKDDMEQM